MGVDRVDAVSFVYLLQQFAGEVGLTLILQDGYVLHVLLHVWIHEIGHAHVLLLLLVLAVRFLWFNAFVFVFAFHIVFLFCFNLFKLGIWDFY